ncbi:MAG: DUF4160 domain-containing protein [Desulfitobacteriia bacterium]|jgi:hypothetical protein
MPIISMFFGIKITINWKDHLPPHFHAEYNNEAALVSIIDPKVIKGKLPKRQLKMVLAWAEMHSDELMQNWELARNNEPLNKIAPLC